MKNIRLGREDCMYVNLHVDVHAACFMFSLLRVAGLAEDSDSEHFHTIISSSKLHSKRLRSQDLVRKKWSLKKKTQTNKMLWFQQKSPFIGTSSPLPV